MCLSLPCGLRDKCSPAASQSNPSPCSASVPIGKSPATIYRVCPDVAVVFRVNRPAWYIHNHRTVFNPPVLLGPPSVGCSTRGSTTGQCLRAAPTTNHAVDHRLLFWVSPRQKYLFLPSPLINMACPDQHCPGNGHYSVPSMYGIHTYILQRYLDLPSGVGPLHLIPP
ncbi:hypothetical protein BDV59DRAFT_103737 [Aspergillus ambiguus]|uniref:uncharacterized protein n=1 Tax=Aspergillus ambiguus TaxID=176160 RepID=UPI003CCD270C